MRACGFANDALDHHAASAEADALFEDYLARQDVSRQLTPKLCGGVRVAAYNPVAAIVRGQLPGLDDFVLDGAFSIVLERCLLFGRPIENHDRGKLRGGLRVVEAP